MRTLLVDGDAVVFRVAAATSKEIDWGDGIVTKHTDKEAAKGRIAECIHGWLETLKADEAVLAFSDNDNFRKRIFPEYKAHRTDEKPLAYRELVAWAKEEWKSYVRPGLEGDDVLGILATGDKIIKGEKIVVADDKDMKGVPCKLFRPWAGDGSVLSINEAQADYWHLYQTLIGDTADGYPGCPKVGPVKADKVLGEYTLSRSGEAAKMNVAEAWGFVLDAFLKAGMTAEYALAMARCARILRRSDYDLNKKEPILWTPPKQ